MAELQRVPVERHDQPAEEGPAEGIPLVPGRVQWTQRVQQAQTITSTATLFNTSFCTV